jgi:hypothetical protein
VAAAEGAPDPVKFQGYFQVSVLLKHISRTYMNILNISIKWIDLNNYLTKAFILQ